MRRHPRFDAEAELRALVKTWPKDLIKARLLEWSATIMADVEADVAEGSTHNRDGAVMQAALMRAIAARLP